MAGITLTLSICSAWLSIISNKQGDRERALLFIVLWFICLILTYYFILTRG